MSGLCFENCWFAEVVDQTRNWELESLFHEIANLMAAGLVWSELDKNLITGTSSTPWTYMAMDFAIPMVSAIRIIMPVKSTASWAANST